MKKLLAILLSLVVAISSVSVVFADPPELDTPVTEEDIEGMWASGTYSVPANSYVDTPIFYLGACYFAYEMCATGGSGTYQVALRRGSGTKAYANHDVNGINYKYDWITINTSGNYYLRITNFTSSSISVTLTYYSWV